MTAMATILILVAIHGGCAVAPESESLEGVRETAIHVLSSEWYERDQIVPNLDTVGSLLSSKDPDVTQQRACMENILAKLASPAGQPGWDSDWTPRWFHECLGMARDGTIGQEHGGASFCWVGKHNHRPVNPATDGRLIKGVMKLGYVTRQRVYAEIGVSFFNVLLDQHRFIQSDFDGGGAHEEPLKRFIEHEGMDASRYEFKSWREKRRRGSLQCVAASPRLGREERHFVDIEIDEWNPLADVTALGKHWNQVRQGYSTDHSELQEKPYFRDQEEVLYHLRRLWSQADSMSGSDRG